MTVMVYMQHNIRVYEFILPDLYRHFELFKNSKLIFLENIVLTTIVNLKFHMNLCDELQVFLDEFNIYRIIQPASRKHINAQRMSPNIASKEPRTAESTDSILFLLRSGDCYERH